MRARYLRRLRNAGYFRHPRASRLGAERGGTGLQHQGHDLLLRLQKRAPSTRPLSPSGFHFRDDALGSSHSGIVVGAFEQINENRMDTAVKARTASKSVVKERQDLRAWIDQLRAAGELTDIKGAE